MNIESLNKSLSLFDSRFGSLNDIRDWISRRNSSVSVSVSRRPFRELRSWSTEDGGAISHDSGKFFSIIGIHVETDYGGNHSWDQPIINQPEIGYLGIITKEFDGVLFFLMQAKIEPGNVNCVQISPTLQATKSNYTRVHKGKTAAYLEYFQNVDPSHIILDQLQSEQGARFLKKRNRNIIIEVDEDIEVHEDFRWMTLGQIKALMQEDNVINMDTRTVIAGLQISSVGRSDDMTPFGKDLINSERAVVGIHSMNDHLSWLSKLKASFDLNVTYKPLDSLDGWDVKDDEISRSDGKYFKVIGVDVSIANREISSWCQPIIQPMQTGLCAFVIKKIKGIYHFLVQAKLECGNLDVFELAPTVQCLTGNVFESTSKPPFVEYVLHASKDKVLYDAMQSEEGGRFYHEQNRNMIVVADESFAENLPETYIWMTLGQIHEFLKFNNYINIQARSLIAALRYYD